jgi:hypothetical protein
MLTAFYPDVISRTINEDLKKEPLICIRLGTCIDFYLSAAGIRFFNLLAGTEKY